MISIRINKLRVFLSIAAMLSFNLIAMTLVLAQSPANCDPWPTETDQILACLDYYNQNPAPKTYDPGTNPASPVGLPFTGTFGLDAAYSSALDEVLVVGSDSLNGTSDFTHIQGILADPKTLAPKSAEFQIDEAKSQFRGTPKIVYAQQIDKFFVAWEDSRPSGNNRSTYARFISGDGTPQGHEINIAGGVGFLNSVAYDPVNHKFVILREPGFPQIVTVDESGNVDARTVAVAHNPNEYQGQGSLAVNTSLNQYWVAYVKATAEDQKKEDDRIMFQKIAAATGNKVGDPIQLSQTRVGRNNLASAYIAYSPADQAAVAIWLERGRDGAVAAIYGRTIHDDGTLSLEYPVLTPGTDPASPGYGPSSFKYNPYTGSFFVGAQDWVGGAYTTELDASGLVYDARQTIAPPCSGGACGTYYVAITPTDTGSVTLGSLSYTKVAGTSQRAVSVLPAAPAEAPIGNPPPKISLGGIGATVGQIYIWSLGAAALLALFMIVIGGYLTLTSAGNADRAGKGKSFILSSLIGLALLFGSYILLRTINPDLVDFSNNTAETIIQPQ